VIGTVHRERRCRDDARGTRYIIRTDIVYERRPAQCTLPEDQEAFRLYMEAQEKAEKSLCQEAMELFRRAFKMSAGLRRVYGQ